MIRLTTGLLLLMLLGGAAADECALSNQGLTTRPAAGAGPTEVRLGLYVNDIIKIQDVEQSFVSDVFFRADWIDRRLVHDGPEPCTVSIEQIWTPNLQSLNRRSIERIRQPDLEVAPDGRVKFVLRVFGEFSYRADLGDFPFDSQELIYVIVAGYGPEEVQLVAHPKLIGKAERVSVANWRIELGATRALTEYIAPADRHIARFDVVFEAERLTGYYTWQLLVPLFLVVMMSWAVFWIAPEFVPPRVGLAATSMLTLIAYRFAMTSILPPIAYLTRMDVFMVGSSVLVFGALAGTVAVTYVADRGNEALAGKINRSGRWLSPLLFLVVVAVAFWG